MNYSYSYESTLSPVGSIICLLICLAVLVIQIVAMWKMFEKAGVEGWKRATIFTLFRSLCQFYFFNYLGNQSCKSIWKRNWIWDSNDFLCTDHVYDTCIF